jgi:hypothetical protein
MGTQTAAGDANLVVLWNDGHLTATQNIESGATMTARNDIIAGRNTGTGYSEAGGYFVNGVTVVDSASTFIGPGGINTSGQVYTTNIVRGSSFSSTQGSGIVDHFTAQVDGASKTMWIGGGIIYAKTLLAAEDQAAFDAELARAQNPPAVPPPTKAPTPPLPVQPPPAANPVIPSPNPPVQPPKVTLAPTTIPTEGTPIPPVTVTPPPNTTLPPSTPLPPPPTFTISPPPPAPAKIVPPPAVAPLAPAPPKPVRDANAPPITEPKASPLPTPPKPIPNVPTFTMPPFRPNAPNTPSTPQVTPPPLGPAPTVPKPVPPYVPPPIPPLDQGGIARFIRQQFTQFARVVKPQQRQTGEK